MTARALAFLVAVLLAALLGAKTCPAQNAGQDEQMFLEPDSGGRVFYVRCTGTVDDKIRFNDVTAQVTLSFNALNPANRIQVIIDPRPALAARNSFYWNSNDTSVSFGGQSLRSTLKPLFTKESTICFYYMSPSLYHSKQALTHREAERIRWVDTYAKPIRIFATQGELTMKLESNMIKGKLWMVGYDTLANRPVRYVADFAGQEYVEKKSKH